MIILCTIVIIIFLATFFILTSGVLGHVFDPVEESLGYPHQALIHHPSAA